MDPTRTRLAAIAIALAVSLSAYAQGSKTKPARASATAGAKIDLNTATEAELDTLPGVGKATAKKIIAGRPYNSPADLNRAGVPKRTVDRITPIVTTSQPSRGSASRSAAPSPMPAPSVPARSPSNSTAAPVGTPGSGMVWVNTDTKVYHRQGDRWYGNTKHGQYMTEQQAIQMGARAAKK